MTITMGSLRNFPPICRSGSGGDGAIENGNQDLRAIAVWLWDRRLAGEERRELKRGE